MSINIDGGKRKEYFAVDFLLYWLSDLDSEENSLKMKY